MDYETSVSYPPAYRIVRHTVKKHMKRYPGSVVAVIVRGAMLDLQLL